ncbi:glycosyltransferase family 2 protein [Clostridium thermarum]|uniref:glycosyltransferase family 2 protein n=1 Tax=Clostridium thermarum TaxID=1716543 RepID=UPI0013D87E4F|nr:glycosyltransferase family 2 protein [Clostridium thermarum]
MDKVSVIIPTYNRDKTIERAIKSVLNQTYNNIEIIVVDDNSSDKTCDIVNSIDDDRIKYIKLNSNMGACYARNVGIKQASGNYIAFQDSDDSWHKDKLEKQIKYLKDNGFDVVSCVLLQIYENGKTNKFPSIRLDKIKLSKYIYRGNIYSTITILGKKGCFENIMFDERLPRFQDWDLMIRMSQEYNVGILDECLVDAYIQRDSISQNSKKAVEAFKIFENKYASNDKELKAYYNRQMAIFSLEDSSISKSYFKEAFKNNPKDPKNLYNYVLIKLGMFIIVKKIYKAKRKL